MKWTLPAEVYASLTPIQRRGMTTGHGVFFDDAEHAILMRTNALPGYWIVMGDQRVMSDTNGNFVIDVPHGITNGFAVAQYGYRSTQAEAVFTTEHLAPVGGKALPILVRFERRGGLHMDGDLPALAGSPGLAGIHLTEVRYGNPAVHVGNSKACCLDYDGYLPSDCKGAEDTAEAVSHYIGSTCHKLVEAGLCSREWNALRFAYGLPYAPLTGPSCFENHKFRNCQNIDETFAISSSGESENGSLLRVHNNTRANETLLTVSSGKLIGEGVQPGLAPGTFWLVHYDTMRHLNDLVVTYVPDSATPSTTFQIKAEAGGQTRILTLAMCPKGKKLGMIPTSSTVTFGGAPWCRYQVVLQNIEMELSLDRCRAGGSITCLSVEAPLDNCTTIFFPPSQHWYRSFNGVVSGKSPSVTLRTPATFQHAP